MRDLSGCNVLFVTLDCCRFDTAVQAEVPTLRRLAPIRIARTHGTYTLPAHMSFFMGYLPSVIDAPLDGLYASETKQLWRLRSGRSRQAGTVAIPIDGDNVIDGYKRMGFRTIGSGGVRWFRHAALTGLFEEFHFYGETDEYSLFAARKPHEFPLHHIDDLVRRVGSERYFLFVNCPETHCPYDFGEGYLSQEVQRTIETAQHIWGFKVGEASRRPVDTARLRFLHEAQKWALEAVDVQLGLLIDRLPKPLLVVVCGDHGECFGEDGHWGHGYAHPTVMEVPLVISVID